MRVVVSLGGNALLRRGQAPTVHNQQLSVAAAAAQLGPLAAGTDLVVTHGKGPQVGLLALQAAAYDEASAYPFDVMDAQTEGMIGYLLERELRNRLTDGRDVVTVLTMVEVRTDDPAFERPTKFVGPAYREAEARALAARHDWTVAPDGDGWRRVVPSPAPHAVLELASIEELVIATDVDAVYRGWGTEDAERIIRIHPDDVHADAFPSGSMRPKLEAAAAFGRTGGAAVIGSIDDLGGLAEGRSGTRVSVRSPRVAVRTGPAHV